MIQLGCLSLIAFLMRETINGKIQKKEVMKFANHSSIPSKRHLCICFAKKERPLTVQ